MDLFEDYSQRLITYNGFVMVHYKVSPSKIAKYGWIWEDGILKCVSCQSKYKIQEFSEDLDLRKPQYLRCLNDLRFSHDKNCPYYDCQRFKISQDFMHINAISYYKECLNSLKAIDVDLKFIDRIPTEYKIVFYDGNQLSIRKAAAIFGWQSFNDKLLCKYCGRIAENTPQFDIFIEHRYFCNWCNESINKQSKIVYILESFGFIYLIQQLYEEYVTNGQAKPNEYVKLGAIRRQIGQYVETMIKESNEISAYLAKMNQENQLINQQIKQRNKFDLNKFREEQQRFQQEIQKKIKLNEELMQSEKKLQEEQEQKNNQIQESEFKNLLEQQIQQEKMIIEEERVSFRFDEYVQPIQESQKNFEQVSFSQLEQRLNDLQSFKNVEQDEEQFNNQNQQDQIIQEKKPNVGGKTLPQDFVIMTHSLFTNEEEVRRHEQEVQQQQEQEQFENARKQFEIELPQDDFKFVSLNQPPQATNNEIENKETQKYPIIQQTSSHIIVTTNPNIVQTDSIIETGEFQENQVPQNNLIKIERQVDIQNQSNQEIQEVDQIGPIIKKEEEIQVNNQIDLEQDDQQASIEIVIETPLQQEIINQQDDQIQQVVKDLSSEYQNQQKLDENQQQLGLNQQQENQIQQQGQDYLDQIEQVDQQEQQHQYDRVDQNKEQSQVSVDSQNQQEQQQNFSLQQNENEIEKENTIYDQQQEQEQQQQQQQQEQEQEQIEQQAQIEQEEQEQEYQEQQQEQQQQLEEEKQQQNDQQELEKQIDREINVEQQDEQLEQANQEQQLNQEVQQHDKDNEQMDVEGDNNQQNDQ